MPNGGFHLSHNKYITDLLTRAQVQNGKGVNTPMASGLRFTAHGSELVKDIQLYRNIIGALQYTAITRLEKCF